MENNQDPNVQVSKLVKAEELEKQANEELRGEEYDRLAAADPVNTKYYFTITPIEDDQPEESNPEALKARLDAEKEKNKSKRIQVYIEIKSQVVKNKLQKLIKSERTESFLIPLTQLLLFKPFKWFRSNNISINYMVLSIDDYYENDQEKIIIEPLFKISHIENNLHAFIIPIPWIGLAEDVKVEDKNFNKFLTDLSFTYPVNTESEKEIVKTHAELEQLDAQYSEKDNKYFEEYLYKMVYENDVMINVKGHKYFVPEIILLDSEKIYANDVMEETQDWLYDMLDNLTHWLIEDLESMGRSSCPSIKLLKSLKN